jgi:hypothetical protein
VALEVCFRVGSVQLFAVEGGEKFLKIVIIVFLELRKDQLIERRNQKAEFIEKLVSQRKIVNILGWAQTIFGWTKPTSAQLWLRH